MLENLDNYKEGLYDSESPINQEELPPFTELEEQQEWNLELRRKIIKAKIDINFLISYAAASNNTYLTNKLKQIKL